MMRTHAQYEAEIEAIRAMNLKLQLLLTEALTAVAAGARMASASRHLMSIYDNGGEPTGEDLEIARYALGEGGDL